MSAISIDPATAAVLGAAGAAFLLLLGWLVHFLTEPTVYIERVESLLTPAEQKFYEALDEAIDGRLMILSKVRLADLLNLTSESSSARSRVFRSIASKHVDFVLVEPANLRPLAAIELDDSTHQHSDRRKRDLLLEDLFHKAALPLLRFKTAARYDHRTIEAEVAEVLGEALS
jgi:Protein of unknown function (DUF2726)